MTRALRLALGLLSLAACLPARESLRLPWAFSDEPDLSADFGFAPGKDGETQVDLSLGGRFASFGLPKNAPRAPQLFITCAFNDPARLERAARSLSTTVDLNAVLGEYGSRFERRHFSKGSDYVYKADLVTSLEPGDYNVRIVLQDEVLGLESRRTLHLIVPAFDAGQWQLGDLKFITAAGKRLNEKGKEERVLDPNPWRQVGRVLPWDLMLAYSDLGPRPAGPLQRRLSVRRLRGDEAQVWSQEDKAPPKRTAQVWLATVPQKELARWSPGVYLFEVELAAGQRKIKASKTFEVLP